MSKKELKEKVESMGYKVGSKVTVDELQTIIDNHDPLLDNVAVPDQEPAQEEVKQEPAQVEGLDVSDVDVDGPEEVKESPSRPSMFSRGPSFVEKLEECVDKCRAFINNGGNEKEMKAYFKGLSK